MTNNNFGVSDGDRVRRDRWGRPVINPLGGGKPEPYTRVSTLAKAISDTSALQDWKSRMTLKGAALRPDLIALAQSTDDRKALNNAAKQALEAANAQKAANVGTALHSFSELVDIEGGTLEDVPEVYRPHIAKYQEIVSAAGIQMVAAESFVVNDHLKAAGSLDRLVMFDGELMVSDLKTGGALNFFAVETAMQVATYANSVLYDVDSGERNDLPVSTTRGLLIHLPQDDLDKAGIYVLDLVEGYRLAKLAVDVRQGRKAKVTTKVGE